MFVVCDQSVLLLEGKTPINFYSKTKLKIRCAIHSHHFCSVCQLLLEVVVSDNKVKVNYATSNILVSGQYL